MGGASLSVGVAIGAVLLAVWLDIRLEARRPTDPMRRIGHGLAAFVVLEIAVGLLAYAQAAHMAQPMLLVGFFALFVPALAYACLTGLWLLRTLIDVARLVR
jgi:heme A synthase